MRRTVVRFVSPGAAWLLLAVASAADAYPWMIRHEYTQCITCHVDPSGGGLLNEYGRAQHELILPALYSHRPADFEPKPDILFGAVRYPEWLNAGISIRGALLDLEDSLGQNMRRPILMIADLRGELLLGPVRALATLGFDPTGAHLASLTNNTYDNLISREHYLAVDLADRSVIVRAGRINMPFGLRNVEHPSWVRSETRTDINSSQEYGVAVAFTRPWLRAELMGIAGNFLLRFPEYRERGYSGYAEHAFSNRATLGLSSLVATSDKDLVTNEPGSLRQAHGLFSRLSPFERLGFLLEADALLQSSQVSPLFVGYVGFAQADFEPVQGVHLFVTGETLREQPGNSFGGWLSASYMFFAYGELRVDAIWRRTATPFGIDPNFTVLAQLHLSM